MKRRGFTLIELVVVIALIALLGTMLVMGIGHMQTNGKRQQTRLIMQNLSAMFADYDVNRRVPFGAGNLSPTLAQGIRGHLVMPAPGNVADGNDRTATVVGSNPAVLITRDFMAQLMSVPNNSTAIGKLPSSSLMTFVGSSPTPAPAAWDGKTAYDLYSGVTYTDAYSNKTVYVRTQAYFDSDSVANGKLLNDDQHVYNGPDDPTFIQNAPPNYYYWLPALTVPAGSTTPLPTPVMLDAWGNPIIFVMGGVLGAVNAGGQTAINVNSPDYHPFFASAGPDGDFSKGDDNLYSFEK